MRAPFVFAALVVATLTLPGALALLTLDDGGAVLDAQVAGVGAVAGLTKGDFLVGYKEGQEEAALLAVQLAGGTVRRVQHDLRLAEVEAADAQSFTATVVVSPSVEYAESNGPVLLNGAQWNGAEWNGAEWNGAEWNGAEWNGAQWNGAQWNGAQWNGAHNAPASANDPGRFLQWGLAAAQVPPAWATHPGERRAHLCVIDSGVDWTHRDLAENVWTGPGGTHGYNAVNDSLYPFDDAGHGTHVAGIAAAAVTNGWGVAGVGNVQVMAAKVLDANGAGTEADLAFGVAWCANAGADVALMALSASEPGPALDRALDYAAARGVLLVASAGNDGPSSGVAYPARHPAVMAVSAIDVNRTLAPYSSRGAEVDLAAPGDRVLSTFPGQRFVFGSGTSQAAAFVAGAAALARDADPTLSAAQTRGLLLATARDLGPAGPDASYGRGLLTVGAAVETAAAP